MPRFDHNSRIDASGYGHQSLRCPGPSVGAYVTPAWTNPMPAEDSSRLDEQDGRSPRGYDPCRESHREALP